MHNTSVHRNSTKPIPDGALDCRTPDSAKASRQSFTKSALGTLKKRVSKLAAGTSAQKPPPPPNLEALPARERSNSSRSTKQSSKQPSSQGETNIAAVYAQAERESSSKNKSMPYGVGYARNGQPVKRVPYTQYVDSVAKRTENLGWKLSWDHHADPK